MEKTNLDLRVRRTLRNIREAFYELIMEEDFHQISITELTKRADINRKTFYLHYNSLDDLVDEIEHEMAEKLMAEFEKDTSGNLDVSGCIRIFYNFLDSGSEVEQKLLCDPEYTFFYDKLTNDILSSPFFTAFYEATECPRTVRAFCVAVTAIFRAWIRDNRPVPIEQLIGYADQLITNGYNAVKKKD